MSGHWSPSGRPSCTPSTCRLSHSRMLPASTQPGSSGGASTAGWLTWSRMLQVSRAKEFSPICPSACWSPPPHCWAFPLPLLPSCSPAGWCRHQNRHNVLLHGSGDPHDRHVIDTVSSKKKKKTASFYHPAWIWIKKIKQKLLFCP